jgi:hypothetical protein
MAKAPRKKASVLRRYTSVPALLHLLQNRQITLLSPTLWDDKNDTFFMNQYKQRKKVKSVLALCFTMADDTYHHWKVFTQRSDGARITFRRKEFLAAFAKVKGIRKGPVKYKRVKDVQSFRPAVTELPFLKRHPYRDEKEFRIIYTDQKEEIETKGFDIDLACIERVTLSPWMPKSLKDAVKSTIHSIPGCEKMKVFRSTLLENEQWKRSAMPNDGYRPTK